MTLRYNRIIELAAEVAILAFSSLGVPAISFAQTPAYGITFFDQGNAGAVADPEVEYQNLKRLSFASHFAETDPASGSSNALYVAISDGKLYGYVNAAAGTSFETSSYAGMDAYFFDTFYITGPAGTVGELNATLSFNGTVTGTCSFPGAPCQIDNLVDSFNLLENGIVDPGLQYSGIIATIAKTFGSPNHQTSAINISLTAGSAVVLGGLLQFRDYVQNESSSGNLAFAGGRGVPQTGFFTVSPVTPGFGFTTASGLLYASVPEDAVAK